MLKKININNYHYEYELVGTGHPNWLFLHGFMGTYADFKAIKPVGTCIYLNLLGFGPNQPSISKERFLIENQAHDLAVFITQLKLDKLNLVGYSMGGRLAIAVALLYPEKINKLILESTTAGLENQLERVTRQNSDQEKADKLEDNGLENFVNNWEKLPLFATQTQLTIKQKTFMHQQRLLHNVKNVANSLRMMGTGYQPNYWPQLKQINVETVVIVGANDDKFMKIGARIQKNILNSQIVVIKDAGHNVHFEKPKQYNEVLANIEN